MSAVSPSVSESYAPNRVWQQTLFRMLHQLLGLSLGLLLVSQGLSGAVLVWRPELERLTVPKSPFGMSEPRSLDAEQAAVQHIAPNGIVRMVRLAEKPNSTDEWYLTIQAPDSSFTNRKAGMRRTVYLAPGTAKVLGVRGRQRAALDFLVEFHHNLLMGPLGRAVLGYLALATILLALSGLWLWWPATWKSSRFRPRAAAKPLHYAAGFWAMGPLLIIATTALYFVWRQPIQRVFGVAGLQRTAAQPSIIERGRGRQHRGPDPGRALAAAPSLDAIVAAATAAVPTERVATLRFPDEPRSLFTVLLEPRNQHYRAAPDSVTVRILPNGRPQVDSVRLWNQMPRRKRLLEWLPRIHQAEVGGIPIRMLWSITGCMPALLYVSGFLMWRRRVRAAKNSFANGREMRAALQQEPGGHVRACWPQPTGERR
ncbi:MAG TPA: PepSY-associated TM helix domain-containing protein [Acidobacteriaceae bacterium]